MNISYNSLIKTSPQTLICIREGNFYHAKGKNAWVFANVCSLKLQARNNIAIAGGPVDSLAKYKKKFEKEHISYIFVDGDTIVTSNSFSDNNYSRYAYEPIEKPKREAFHLYHESQMLLAYIYKAFANTGKFYRLTLAQDIFKMAQELIYLIRIGNGKYTNGSDGRARIQVQIIEIAEKLNDLIPVAGFTECISISDEVAISERIQKMIAGIKNWQAGQQIKMEDK